MISRSSSFTRKPTDKSFPVSVVQVSGDNDEFITLGNKVYYRHELMTAFAGELMPDRYAPYPKHHFGNASAVGLAMYGVTNFVLGLYLAGAMGIEVINVALSLCIFCAGFIGAIAGIWELIVGNVFAGTALTSYGLGFWISFGVTYMKAFGVMEAYAEAPEQLNNAIGIYLLGWGFFGFLIFMVTVKSTFPLMLLFLTVDLVFFVLCAYYFTGNKHCERAGGILCVISACCGWYCAFSGTATPQNSYFRVHELPIPLIGKSHSTE